MRRRLANPHAELCAWANGLRPDSPKTVDPMADLVCKSFVPDPDSRYCLDCGYLRHEHRPAQTQPGE